jgi:hypothetical protein
MVLRFRNVEVNCEEFSSYVTSIGERVVSEITFLIDTDIEKIEEIYSDPFMIITPTYTTIFGGYALEEYYEEDGVVRIICRK